MGRGMPEARGVARRLLRPEEGVVRRGWGGATAGVVFVKRRPRFVDLVEVRRVGVVENDIAQGGVGVGVTSDFSTLKHIFSSTVYLWDGEVS